MKYHELITHSQPKCKNCWTKRQLSLESPEGCVCWSLHRFKLYGCAAIPNRFLVALLFHYLIGKRVSAPHLVSTSLSSTQWSISIQLHSLSEVVLWFFISVVFFSLQDLFLWGRHSSFLCTWNSLAGGTGRVIVQGCLQLMFSTLSHTLYIFPIFFSMMFNPSPMPSIPVFL